MKREFRDRWCAALRSGQYMQGIDELRDINNRYCCLGVAQEVAGIPFILAEPETTLLRDEVADAVGLPRAPQGPLSDDGTMTFGRLDRNNLQVHLADLNGVQRFHEIADWIEKNVPVED